jgi:signal transduction histidine kinase
VLVPERFRGAHPEYRRGFSANPQVRAMGADQDLFGLRKDGTEVPIEIGLNPIQTEKGRLVLSSILDITERKRAEEELRQAQAAQFEINLETRVRERTRIARELHDTLLQNFHGLLLRFQSVLKMLPERPQEARRRLHSALDQAAEAITDARNAIQGLRSLASETGDLARAITAVGEELTAQSTDPDSPALQVEVEGAPRPLNPVVRDEVYRIAGEALRNAFRHAQARRIAVEIRYGEGQFRLRVRDDGKGLDDQAVRRAAAAGHFGLPGMRERAENVGGRLEVRSRIDSGTEVELSIPGENAYGGTARRSWLSKGI